MVVHRVAKLWCELVGLASTDLHLKAGNLGMADGSVQQTTLFRLDDRVAKRHQQHLLR